MRFWYYLILLICSSFKAVGQVGPWMTKGSVTDLHGLSLAGVAIQVEGSAFVTFSDEFGRFFLKAAKENFIVKASCVGYRDTTILVRFNESKTSNCQIMMAEQRSTLKEVTISSYAGNSRTATSMLLPIKDIPQSVTVIGQELIRRQAAHDLSTVTRNVPGLIFTGNYGGGGSSQFFNARGFDLNNFQNYRLNGVMVLNLGNQYSDNVAEVEFLKGPASILHGDVAPGGVINFVTKKPEPDFAADARLRIGSQGLMRPSIDLRGPLSKDKKLRYRLNTSVESSGSFRNHVESSRYLVAPALSWKFSEQLTLNLEATFKKSRSTDDAGLVSPDGTVSGLKSLDPSLYLGDSAREYKFSDQSMYLNAAYALSPSWHIQFNGFIAKTTNRPFGIWFDQPDFRGNLARREYGFYQLNKNRTASAVISGTIFTGRLKHRILIGADIQSAVSRFTNGGELTLLDTVNLYTAKNERTFDEEPDQTHFQPYKSLIGRKGFFLQDHISLWDEQLQLLAGFRFGQTRQGNDYQEQQIAGTKYNDYKDDVLSKSIFVPRLGLVFRLASASSVYLSFSKGYELNSPDVFAQNYLSYTSPPATVSKQTEIGIKSAFNDGKLTFTFSAFKIDKHNPYGYVYLDPENPDYDKYFVYYEGLHRSQGMELEASGMIFRGMQFNAGASYTVAKVIFDPGYPSGNWLPNAPRMMLNGWLNYECADVVKGLQMGAGVFHKTSFFSSLVNDRNLKLPATYTFDAMVGYSRKSTSVQLNVMNITNQVNYLNPWQFNLFDVAPLRQYMLTICYSFK